nr:MAG TPA: holin [Caudoviricetes sp.]DAX34116.1 MAG TPA: holin [Caudoviricetes sp.]
MLKRKTKWLLSTLLYCSLTSLALAEVRESFHEAIKTGPMVWDILYSCLAGAAGGLVQTIRNLQNPRTYSQNLAVELVANLLISSFAGIMTFLFFSGTTMFNISPVLVMFFACCAGVLGYEIIRKYTDNFKKTVGKTNDTENSDK